MSTHLISITADQKKAYLRLLEVVEPVCYYPELCVLKSLRAKLEDAKRV